MSSYRKRKKEKDKDNDFELIKRVVDSNQISRKEIEDLVSIDHPLFLLNTCKSSLLKTVRMLNSSRVLYSG